MRSENPGAPAPAAEREQKPIWLFAALTDLISMVWAAAAVMGMPSGGLIDDPALRDAVGRAGYMAGQASVIAVVAALVVWVLFYFIVFRKRANFVRALAVLPLLLATTLAVAVPTRIAQANYEFGQVEAMDAWFAGSRARMDALVARLNADVEQAGLNASAMPTQASLGEELERARRGVALFERYQAELDREIGAMRAELEALDIRPAQRAIMLADFERSAGENGPLRRIAELQAQSWRKTVETLELLESRRSAWRAANGQVLFSDEALLARFQSMIDEIGALRAEIEGQQRMLANIEPSAARPEPTQRERTIFAVTRIAYLLLMGFAGATGLALAYGLLASPVLKLSAASLPWLRHVSLGFWALLRALMGLSLVYVAYAFAPVQEGAERPIVPGALVAMALFAAGWLASGDYKRIGVERRFPGMGVRFVVALFLASAIIVGVAHVISTFTQ